MTVRISEEFNDPQGLLANYDAYDQGQRAAVQTQRHVDIRSFVQNDVAAAPLTIADISTMTMDQLSAKPMDALAGSISSGGEHWAITVGTGTLSVGPQADRNHWNGLALTYVTGANAVVSNLVPPIDIQTGFDANDFISLAFPNFPLDAVTLGSSFVDFTSEPNGNFAIGPVASVAFNDVALVASLLRGDTEMRFRRSALNAINLASITAVRFRLQATAMTNLVTNPSFEVDTSGWAATDGFYLNAGATLSRVTTQQWSGSAALQVVTTAAFAAEGANYALAGTFATGTPYSASIYLKGNAGGEAVQVAFGDPAGSVVVQNIALTTGWQRVVLAWTPSVNCTAARLLVKTQNAQALTWFADAAMVVQGLSSPAYFDGTTPGYVWTGTANASTSTAAPFRCMAVRCLAKTWVYAPLDTNTRYPKLLKPVSLDGRANPTSAFPQAQPPVTSTVDWPMLFRATTPSSGDDPTPIDVSLGVPFYTGSMTATNTFSAFLREFPKDQMTMLNLDPSGGTSVSQNALNALGRQPDYDRAPWGARRQSDLDGLTQTALDGMRQDALERVPNYLNASWMEIRVTWGSGTTISFKDRNGNGYSQSITLAANTYYYLLCELEETALRVRILGSDSSGAMNFGTVVYDSTLVNDDLLCERRPGRVGWYAQLADGDAFISNVRVRRLNFGEYRSHAMRSITPVIGAQLAVESSPPNELLSSIGSGPYGGSLTLDALKSQSGRGWKITNPGLVNQGIKTNNFYIEDWDQISIDFDILFPTLPNAKTLVGYLVGEFGRTVTLDLPPLTPDRWQHVRLRPFRGATAPTGNYALVLYQPNSDPGAWYIDGLSIKERTVAWRARAAMPDPWGDTPADWTDFREMINSGSYGGLFASRGNALQVSGRVVKQGASITKAGIVPVYAQLGRLTFNQPGPVSTPTASFTSSVSSRTVSFDGSASSSSIIAWEWSFGDGQFSSGPFVKNVYAQAGTYSVTLTVHDINDNISSVLSTVTVT